MNHNKLIAAGLILTIGVFLAAGCTGGGKPETYIGVIGTLDKGDTEINSPHLKEYLDSSKAKEKGIGYDIVQSEDTKSLEKYDLVILAGERKYSSQVDEKLSEYLEGKGRIIVVGDAGIQTNWKKAKKEYLPFPILSKTRNITYRKLENPQLIPKDFNHPIVTQIQISSKQQLPNCPNSIKVQSILPEDPKNAIVAIHSAEKTPGPDLIPAIRTKSESETSGIVQEGEISEVVHFSYDPGCTPTVFESAIKYLE